LNVSADDFSTPSVTKAKPAGEPFVVLAGPADSYPSSLFSANKNVEPGAPLPGFFNVGADGSLQTITKPASPKAPVIAAPVEPKCPQSRRLVTRVVPESADVHRRLHHGTACPGNPDFGCVKVTHSNSNCCTECAKATGGSVGAWSCDHSRHCKCSAITAVTDPTTENYCFTENPGASSGSNICSGAYDIAHTTSTLSECAELCLQDNPTCVAFVMVDGKDGTDC
jgi:hypothetical protein